ncbi:hypothetical protein [Kineococcus sp. SYSU DK005]|uniref:hypothetical protein n=1 Tax=Kineococcus sp. SYSU DK005 TaxID=3383126 RepID=UPI003D7D9AC0
MTTAVEGTSTVDEHDLDGPPDAGDAADPRARYRVLPERIRVADTTGSRDPLPPPPDSTEGRDPDRDAAVRFPG